MKKTNILCTLILLSLTGGSHALTVTELKEQMQTDAKVTLIDVRPRHDYRESHIPGAINIPAQLVPHKRLPPMGNVVVIGDGVDSEVSRKAAEQLQQLPGIEVEVLDGGMGAWDAANLASTRPRGMHKVRERQLNYQDVQRIVSSNDRAILMDLRRGATGEELTDIRAQFPGATVVRPKAGKWDERRGRAGAKNPTARKQGARNRSESQGTRVDPQRLYVLIDDGDGRAEKAAHRLRGAGVKRVVILTGGERILRRSGQPGRKVRTVSGGEQ